MIDFHRSHFMWKSRPWYPDEFYRYPGGFVGTPGQVYHVRFKLDAMTTIVDGDSGQATEIFLGAPCRTEYTIATRNLFQIPSAEFRLAFSRDYRLTIAARPSHEAEPAHAIRLDEAFQAYQIRVRTFAAVTELTDIEEITTATLAGEWLNARSSYRDPARNLTIHVEYPVNLINVNTDDSEFQVCTGPVILPILPPGWQGGQARLFGPCRVYRF